MPESYSGEKSEETAASSNTTDYSELYKSQHPDAVTDPGEAEAMAHAGNEDMSRAVESRDRAKHLLEESLRLSGTDASAAGEMPTDLGKLDELASDSLRDFQSQIPENPPLVFGQKGYEEKQMTSLLASHDLNAGTLNRLDAQAAEKLAEEKMEQAQDEYRKDKPETE